MTPDAVDLWPSLPEEQRQKLTPEMRNYFEEQHRIRQSVRGAMQRLMFGSKTVSDDYEQTKTLFLEWVRNAAQLDDQTLYSWWGLANRRGDSAFFENYGRALASRSGQDWLEGADDVAVWIIGQWEDTDARPGLCRFTDEAIVALLDLLRKDRELVSLDKVRKLRQRLKLERARGKLIRKPSLSFPFPS